MGWDWCSCCARAGRGVRGRWRVLRLKPVPGTVAWQASDQILPCRLYRHFLHPGRLSSRFVLGARGPWFGALREKAWRQGKSFGDARLIRQGVGGRGRFSGNATPKRTGEIVVLAAGFCKRPVADYGIGLFPSRL